MSREEERFDGMQPVRLGSRAIRLAIVGLVAGVCCGTAIYAQGTGLDACKSKAQAQRPLDVYVPMDSWIYPALDRLHSLGYLDTAFLGVRPWTRRSVERMLEEIDEQEGMPADSQAAEIASAVRREVGLGDDAATSDRGELFYSCEQLYTRMQGVSGQMLRDSFHLGQTITNDYGRPYAPGFNTVNGAAGSAQFGRFSLYARGEYQHSPGYTGYSPGLAAQLASLDLVATPLPPPPNTPQPTIPAGPIAEANSFRLVEANLSYRILNHEISFGKSDHWLGPAMGGAFAYSNNAENIYAFQIDRTEPLYIPLLSKLVGPFRYDFFVGSLKGHSIPNDPWMHIEKINFKPTPNVEFGFERTVIWGGKGRACLQSNGTFVTCNEPITLHTFLKSFFSVSNLTDTEKFSRNDPGARFASFDFSWRLPWLQHWMMLYADSMVHDDVSPADAPRHASIRPGIYLARMPGLPKMDFRFEGANSNSDNGRSQLGSYLYVEREQPQGYTNKGNIMGDWIGRESQGGQAWLTYHLSPMEMVQASFRHAKAANDFIQGGTTQSSLDIHVVKRFHQVAEISADVQHEWWKAPIYKTGRQGNTVATFQLTVYPKSGPKQK